MVVTPQLVNRVQKGFTVLKELKIQPRVVKDCLTSTQVVGMLMTALFALQEDFVEMEVSLLNSAHEVISA